VTLLAPHARRDELDAEALIKEAKRLRRRRWMRAASWSSWRQSRVALAWPSVTPYRHALSRSKGTSPATAT